MTLLAISIDGTQLLLACTGIVIAVFALIIAWRYWLKRTSQQSLEDEATIISLTNRTKYPKVDIFRWSNTLFRFGLSIALGMTILAFSWTTYDKTEFANLEIGEYEDLDQVPPITKDPPPPPPPPPPPVVEPVVDEELLDEDEPEFEDLSITEDTEVTAPPKVEHKPVPPPPPPPPEPEDEGPEFFVAVEEMPSFGDCKDIFNKMERKQCSDKNLLTFLSKNIKYPAIARENNIEGQAVIRFIVESDGTITNTEIVRDLAGGCGDEALRVVNLMKNQKFLDKQQLVWNPGKQQGRPVRVQFNLPIRFKLQ
ncbi:MAG: energy transducer TonB [Saprospiraceae bacterium]|nr:energy transducer TonB [Saprospiraceae bacterium]